MNVKDLVPWGKNRSRDVNRFADQTSPFLALHREMNRMFDDFMRDFDLPGRNMTAWPHIGLSETDDEIRVVAELAGLEERDVDVTLDEGASPSRVRRASRRTARCTANDGRAHSSA